MLPRGKQEGRKFCSETYPFISDLGFEDLSHFSYVFKKQFGYSLTSVIVNACSRNLKILKTQK
jgi:hypothetical protein